MSLSDAVVDQFGVSPGHGLSEERLPLSVGVSEAGLVHELGWVQMGLLPCLTGSMRLHFLALILLAFG